MLSSTPGNPGLSLTSDIIDASAGQLSLGRNYSPIFLVTAHCSLADLDAALAVLALGLMVLVLIQLSWWGWALQAELSPKGGRWASAMASTISSLFRFCLFGLQQVITSAHLHLIYYACSDLLMQVLLGLANDSGNPSLSRTGKKVDRL